jgi:hypothetical protein
MGFGGNKQGSTYVQGWMPGDNGYAVSQPYTYTVTTTTRGRVSYYASRPGKRWKK